MVINERLLRSLHNSFTLNSRCSFVTSVSPDVDLGRNNLFRIFLRVDLSGTEIEFPTITGKDSRDTITFNIRNENKIDDIAIPLFETQSHYERRTANSIFRLFQSMRDSDRLLKVITNKGEVYYGNKGLILDKDFNILFLTTIQGSIHENRLVYTKARVYIHPKVFGSEGLLEKGLIKTVIPAFTTTGVETSMPRTVDNRINYYVTEKTTNGEIRRLVKPLAEIVIADVSERFLVKPAKPNPATFHKDAVNDFLLTQLDDIVSQL